MSADLEPRDRALLDRAQAGVPLVPRPFAALAAALGADEEEVLARLGRLTAAGVLRQIGGIFDTRACGYASALVAARIPPGGVEAAAEVVGRHPGVSHCYERDHPWNLWFTLAVPPASALGLDGSAARLGTMAGAAAIRVLPALRTFKIAARFALDGDGDATSPPGRPPDGPGADAGALRPEDVAAVRALQRPLGLVAEPFARPAREAGVTVPVLLARGQALLARGTMRRFAALLNHRRAGFGANVMAAWAVPDDRLETSAAAIVALPAVTHCYARPTFADWPYGLFSMVHGRTREACEEVLAAIGGAIRPEGWAALWTRREFKKTRLQLFTPEAAVWEAAVAGAGA